MVDLWVHAVYAPSTHDPDPDGLVFYRPDHSGIIATGRQDAEQYALECYRDGNELFYVKVPDAGTAVDLIWDWIRDDWTRLESLIGRSDDS
jgi:hypothetical protein